MAEIATQCESLDFWTFEPWWNLSSAQRPKGVMTFHVSKLWNLFRCNSVFFAPTLNNFITKMPSNLNTWVAKNGLFDLTCFFQQALFPADRGQATISKGLGHQPRKKVTVLNMALCGIIWIDAYISCVDEKLLGCAMNLWNFQKKLSNMPSLFPLLEGRPLEGGRKSASTHQRPWSNMVTVYISISIHVGISYTAIFWKVWTCLYPNHFFDLLSLLPSNLNLIESIIVCLISISTPAHNVN